MEIKYVIGKLIQFLQIPQIHDSKIDKTSKVRFGALVVGTNVGRHTYISERSTILYADIGSFTSIASDCNVGGASHPMEWVSTSPVFQGQSSVLKQKFEKFPYSDTYKRTKIGNDVWIGNNVLIKSGVSIGDGAVIGMGSVVTKDVGSYEIWAGDPAKKIRNRLDETIANKLLEIKWWDMEDEEIKMYSEHFNDPKSFINAVIYGKHNSEGLLADNPDNVTETLRGGVTDSFYHSRKTSIVCCTSERGAAA